MCVDKLLLLLFTPDSLYLLLLTILLSFGLYLNGVLYSNYSYGMFTPVIHITGTQHYNLMPEP